MLNPRKHTLLFLLIFTIIFYNQYIYGNCNKTNLYTLSILSEDKILDANYFITILNDDNFTDYGFPGSGTEEDPYRIEDIHLSSSDNFANGIAIANTSMHFIIQNCFLTAYWSAIILENVTQGTATIRNNLCYRSDVGIGLISSNNVSIINNICENYNSFGIFLYYSNLSLVSKNNCSLSKVSGIYSENSHSNWFESNNCSANLNTGIGLHEDFNATLVNNICNNNYRGAILQSSGSKINNNSFCYNGELGCSIEGMNNSSIHNNEFKLNTGLGCRVKYADACNFTFNNFEKNSEYGLSFDSYSSENIIHHNRFTNNFLSGTSQASDNGENNIWFEQDTKEGNYWSGWNKKKSYQIDGSAQSQDPYPLDETLTKISFCFILSLISFPILVIIINKNSKRKSTPQRKVSLAN